MLAGFLLIKIVLFAVRGALPRVNTFFRKTQYLTLIGLGLSHGSNDAQKTMGVITLGLISAGMLDTLTVSLWVVFASATAIALGTLIGGWKLIRTLGGVEYTEFGLYTHSHHKSQAPSNPWCRAVRQPCEHYPCHQLIHRRCWRGRSQK